MSAVSAEGVWKFYGDFPALRDITFQVEPGACLALLGRNGAGKTTLLRILAGLLRPARGAISIFGEDARRRETRRRIGVLGHGIAIYDELSAFETCGGRLCRLPDPRKSAMSGWADRARAGQTGSCGSSRGRTAARLSPGLPTESCSWMNRSPSTTGNRDQPDAAAGAGRAIVTSTHQLREALELATQVALINRGRLAYYGARTAEMLADPGWLYRNYGEA
jgi:ABC-type multidrug transport system ATPase subunit